MNVFDTSVTIHLVDKVSAALGQVSRQFTKTQTAAAALQSRLNILHSTFNSGVIMAGGGLALAAPLIFATKAAMDLQTALGRVQIATGASNAQMAQLNETLTQTANATGIFSKPTLAAFAANMYSSGITNMNQINELLPLFAKGADLMKILSGGRISPEEAAHTFTAMAHQFGRYDAASMTPIVNAAVATAPALPGGLAALRGMGGYVNVLGNRVLGIDPVQLIALEAAINQTSGSSGAGGRGGLSGAMLIAALKRSMPGVFGAGLLTGKSAFSAEVLGLAKGGVSTIFSNGKMDLNKLVDVLTKFESQSGTQIAQEMMAHSSMLGKKAGEERAFLQNFLKTPGAPKAQLLTSLLTSQAGTAATVLQLFGDPKFIAQLEATKARINAFRGIAAMQAEVMKMLSPQLARLQTNFMTLSSTIGMQMIPATMFVVTKLGDFLDTLNKFAEMHPRIVQTIVSLTAAASAMLIFGGAIQIMRAASMGLAFVAGPLGTVLTRLGSMVGAVAPMIGRLGLVIASALGPEILIPLAIMIGAVAIAVANWDKIMGFVHAHSSFFIHIAAMVAKSVEVLGNVFSWLLRQIAALMGGIGKFISGIPGLSGLGNGIAQIVNNAMKVDDLTAKRDENYLKSHGMGWMVAATKGNTTINDHSTHHYTMQQVPGHDHQACLNTLKKAVGSASHAASAASGNSVGRSNATGGATRP